MTTARREALRSIMNLAWSLYRQEPSRGFADCLRGAWRYDKKLAAWAASSANPFKRGAQVWIKPVLRSAIDDARTGQGRGTTWREHRLTGRLGV